MFKRIFFSVLLSFIITTCFAAPSKNLWPRWLTNNPNSTQTINNQLWQNFLNQYVVSKNSNTYVDYQAVTPQAKANLKKYLRYLSKIKIANYNRKVQEAYWINLYNALTVYIVLKHYPIASIRDIKSGWFSSGPWDKHLIAVNDIPISLNDIEHRILRPIYNSPLIHYSVNCASLGCPNLPKTAFSAKNIKQLQLQAAKQYINSAKGVKIENGKLYVSDIYLWYQSDFGGSQQAVIKHLKKYANPSLRNKLNHFNTISGYFYNWALNKS